MNVRTRKDYRFIQPLFTGPIDIVGDIHGETGALLSLLDRLGYDYDGNHPQNRRLVFVGDLVDRGPDSVQAVRIVKNLCEKGKAQCILGNHEFNLLNGKRKHGNHWFYGETEKICKEQNRLSYQVLVETDSEREDLLNFFANLPIILESDQCIVVHAAYSEEKGRKLEKFSWKSDAGPAIIQAHHHFRRKLLEEIKLKKISDEEEVELILQNRDPVKVLLTGFEDRLENPYFAGGKHRTIGRVAWWEGYRSEKLIVIGHYWRRDLKRIDDRIHEIYPQGFEPTGVDMFRNQELNQLLGANNRVMCVDFACGIRYEERGIGLPEGALGTSLGALRLAGDEMSIVFDDGREIEVE